MSVLQRATRKELRKHYGKVRADVIGYFQADLMDMSSYGRYNSGFKYGFVVIDVYSRYGWCYPIRSKDKTFEALIEWLKSPEMQFYKKSWKTFKIHTDEGSEFYGKFLGVAEKAGIRVKHVNSNITHQVVAERLIRTIKERIREVFYEEDSFNWVEYIESIIVNYNESVHRSIRNKPFDVFIGDVTLPEEKNDEEVKEPNLNVGDSVRTIIIKNKITDKPSLTNNWSEKVFKVVSYLGNNYTLDNGQTYQRWKLLKVKENDDKRNKRYLRNVREKQIKHRKAVSHERLMEREIGTTFEEIQRMIAEQPDPYDRS